MHGVFYCCGLLSDALPSLVGAHSTRKNRVVSLLGRVYCPSGVVGAQHQCVAACMYLRVPLWEVLLILCAVD